MYAVAPFVALLATFASGVLGEAEAYGPYGNVHKCLPDRVRLVQNHVAHPAYFCKFYLKDDRKYSPIGGLTAHQLESVCQCILQTAPKTKGPAKSKKLPKAAYNKCNPGHVKAVHNEYAEPLKFARFYNKANRAYSPVPAIKNAQALKKACKCIIAKANGNSGPTKKPTKKPTQKPTKKPTKKTTTTTVAPTTTDAPISYTSLQILPTTTEAPTSSVESSSSSASSVNVIGSLLTTLFPTPTTAFTSEQTTPTTAFTSVQTTVVLGSPYVAPTSAFSSGGSSAASTGAAATTA